MESARARGNAWSFHSTNWFTDTLYYIPWQRIVDRDRSMRFTVYRWSDAVQNRIKDRNLFEDPSPLSSVTWSLVRFECQAELNWSPRGLKRLSILLLPLLPPSFPFTPPSLFTVFLSHLVSCLQRENSHCVRETRNTSLVWPHLSLSLSFFHSFSFSLLTSL